ncbi:Cystathionine beta-synthase, core [Ophiocordyceps camponoti-floridani]|uniref:Cystathionine beta-synthase, core n=1 Tax=Ophiocordyceps camponoti-floridani TaxID=2030778 RepID=A0A8H4Q9H9_9HYPO|nr:Cystathionine beta-synthase, core [Ophiocordyceps camponoti-floridani]
MCSEEKRLPSLGDFTRIRRHVASCCELDGDDGSSSFVDDVVGFDGSAQISPVGAAQLGDFQRLFTQLKNRNGTTKPSISNTRTKVVAINEPEDSSDGSLRYGSTRGENPIATHELIYRLCPTTPIILSRPTEDEPAQGSKSSQASNVTGERPPALTRVTSYQLDEKGPWIPIFAQPRSRKQRAILLAEKLRPLYALDLLRAEKNPQVGINGIHVFLDMSNINISFQNMVRIKYSINSSARFSPLPPLDLQFLTEILVRKRHVVSLNAGCSVPPGRGRHEPKYIQELRECGFHVDLRERKRITTSSYRLTKSRSAAADSSSSEGRSAEASTVRHVEDLVDETLQTRMAESVMKHFQQQGTLVLATGDAQPAKYSDGFLAYAERSLKMGWDVEVVSWKKSLSSHWINADWMASWGDRFRVIELDGFLEDLLAYSKLTESVNK